MIQKFKDNLVMTVIVVVVAFVVATFLIGKIWGVHGKGTR